jgi:hypothetical protein
VADVKQAPERSDSSAKLLQAIEDDGKSAEQARTYKNSNDARDKWIYDECMKGTAYKAIVLRLKNKSPKWVPIESDPGVRRAAIRYAERHGLRPIPLRQVSWKKRIRQ